MRPSLLPALAALALLLGGALASGSALADCPVPASLSLCKTCHSLEPGKPARPTGPNLAGVVGQPAMHSADFKNYSKAMKAAQAKGLVWTDENLVSYLANPKAFLLSINGQPLPNAMQFQVTDEAKRKAAVEGLKTIAACK
jgi:cytochrome c